MTALDSYRKQLLNQQIELRSLLENPASFEPGIQLFMLQHAMLHSARVSQPSVWSYEDALLDNIGSDDFRCLPPKAEHSIAWLIWHSARCEDITMNLLIAGTPQILRRECYMEKLNILNADTGNSMTRSEIEQFSQQVKLGALREYRLAVGQRTRQIAAGLQPAQLKQKVDPVRIQQVIKEGAVLPAAHEVTDYWASRTFAGLLLMPATRHNLVHLNEVQAVQRRLK